MRVLIGIVLTLAQLGVVYILWTIVHYM